MGGDGGGRGGGGEKMQGSTGEGRVNPNIMAVAKMVWRVVAARQKKVVPILSFSPSAKCCLFCESAKSEDFGLFPFFSVPLPIADAGSLILWRGC